jgi:hypothetical protein
MSTFLLFGVLPIVTLLILNLWELYERWRFTQIEGEMKRGVIVGMQPLTLEMRQLLTTLPGTIQYGYCFVRKENSEILFAERVNFLSLDFWWYRRFGVWPHVGYVDLSMSESQIEFRISLSSLIALIISIPTVLAFLFGISLMMFLDDRIYLSLFFLVISSTILIGLALFGYYQQRNHLLAILSEVIEQSQQNLV